MHSKSISVISGSSVIFSGYLLQSEHRPTVIFPCLLHDRGVAKWRFQVSKLRLRRITSGVLFVVAYILKRVVSLSLLPLG